MDRRQFKAGDFLVSGPPAVGSSLTKVFVCETPAGHRSRRSGISSRCSRRSSSRKADAQSARCLDLEDQSHDDERVRDENPTSVPVSA